MSNETDHTKAKLKATHERLSEVSPSFCLAKWYQATLHLHNGNTQSCHHVMSHRVPAAELQARGPSALHNTKKKQKARAQMLAGRKPKECDYCWKVEATGEYSDRVYKSSEDWALPNFTEAAQDAASNEAMPKYLELAFDNLCNFKCMYCSPLYSSSWQAEVEKHGPYPTSRLYNNLSVFKLNGRSVFSEDKKQHYIEAFWQWWPQLRGHLVHLRVTGGEPLLMPATWRLLQELQTQNNPQLNFAINSNLGLSEKIMNRFLKVLNPLLDGLKTVTIYASIDSVGKQAEYIRHGLDENLFFSNLEKVIESTSGRAKVSLMITVNALSVFGLEGLMRKVAALRKAHPDAIIDFDTPYLRNPEHLSVHILPAEMIKYVKQAVAYMTSETCFGELEVERLQRLVALMETRPWSRVKLWLMRRDFCAMMKEHDKRRNTNFNATFPELESYVNQWKQQSLWL